MSLDDAAEMAYYNAYPVDEIDWFEHAEYLLLVNEEEQALLLLRAYLEPAEFAGCSYT